MVAMAGYHNEPKLLTIFLLLTLVDHESMHLWLMVGPIHQILLYLGLGPRIEKKSVNFCMLLLC